MVHLTYQYDPTEDRLSEHFGKLQDEPLIERYTLDISDPENIIPLGEEVSLKLTYQGKRLYTSISPGRLIAMLLNEIYRTGENMVNPKTMEKGEDDLNLKGCHLYRNDIPIPIQLRPDSISEETHINLNKTKRLSLSYRKDGFVSLPSHLVIEAIEDWQASHPHIKSATGSLTP